MSGGIWSRREMARLKQHPQGVSWGPGEGVALGVLIATCAVCLITVGTGLGVVSWRMAQQREPTTSTITNAELDPHDDSYDNQDLYWSILGGWWLQLIFLPLFLLVSDQPCGV